jgi:calcineurin-like phosphoesterase family protein
MQTAGVSSGWRFSWLDPRPLWRSRNDRLDRLLDDPVNDLRRAWMALLSPADPDLVIDHSEQESISFMVLGDTGEGDASQWAVVPALTAASAGASFLFICSDVIYPAGGAGEYRAKFFLPYGHFAQPIYAIPGNHDWYDDGRGFMRWFCGAGDHPSSRVGGPLFRALRLLHIWRRTPHEKQRPGEGDDPHVAMRRPNQPGPYFAIDAGPIRLVAIDTGITGVIDRDQAEWLRRVSIGGRPKVLLTGKPLYVDGDYRPGRIEGAEQTVNEIVGDPSNRYIATVGGDIHNYQRYLAPAGGERMLLHLVSGGGGAFMHQTHTIPNLDQAPGIDVREADFRCYPLRGDSLSRYSELYARKLPLLGGRLVKIDPDEAAAIVAERIDLRPTRPSARQASTTARGRRAASLLFRLPKRGRRGLHLPFSEWLDWDEPPFFKSFLRFDVQPGRVRVRCFAATGCRSQESGPRVEDELVATEDANGLWTWQVVDIGSSRSGGA